MLKAIQNTGEFFATNYFDDEFARKVLQKVGYEADALKPVQDRLAALKSRYFAFKDTYLSGSVRTKDRITETHRFHGLLLDALGYPGQQPDYAELFHLAETEVLPVRHTLRRTDGHPALMILEMQALIRDGDNEPPGLFEQRYHADEDETNVPGQVRPSQRFHRAQWENVFRVPEGLKLSPSIINEAISTLFLLDTDRRPPYILLLAGNVIYLFEGEKWFRGAYLTFDLEELFAEAARDRTLYALFWCLTGRDTLAPDRHAHATAGRLLLDQLDEDSHRAAYEVTKDLREGIVAAVEALANEAVWFWTNAPTDETNEVDARQLKDECLTLVYRLLFLFYAESRPELSILPTDDPVYAKGYSLERLRDLELVPLTSDSSRNGYFFDDSLRQLFRLLRHGYKPGDVERSFGVRPLDSPLFDENRLGLLQDVRIRNCVWQDIIQRLSLSRRATSGRATNGRSNNRRGASRGPSSRGRISYANLGINQLGSVYESLLAYRGFFADEDYILVKNPTANDADAEVVPRRRRDDFTDAEVVRERSDTGAETNREVVIPKGRFLYRLSGRDRQQSASYYTPEVLTQATVRYTLKPILERLVRTTNGEDRTQGGLKATDLLSLNILEPAMGAAAFHNEVINQLAEAYLQHRQAELNRRIAPDQYREELQKVKAHLATNHVYGVDLNPTAVELGKLSLWLNVIHRDMPPPFFGYRLGAGNAVVGAGLRAYAYADVKLTYTNRTQTRWEPREWWENAPRPLAWKQRTPTSKPAIDRKPDEIYHFLLPDKNMVPSGGIKALWETTPSPNGEGAGAIRRSDEVDLLAVQQAENRKRAFADWKKAFFRPIDADEYRILQAICLKIDDLLQQHDRFQRHVARETRQEEVFFGYQPEGQLPMNYADRERLADNRERTNAPYFILRSIMDYWCALWFWDVRQADQLPTRRQWYADVATLLNIDLEKGESGTAVRGEGGRGGKGGKGKGTVTDPTQLNVFGTTAVQTRLDFDQPALTTYRREAETTLVEEAIVEYTDRADEDLFANDRLRLVQALTKRYRFFHYPLEFSEVFSERGGFDVIVGNPPWLKMEFAEADIVAERFPEVAIRGITAPEVRKKLGTFFAEAPGLRALYLSEQVAADSTANFMNAAQNYPLLVGQQTNLYKCVLENTLGLLAPAGYAGLIHPEGIYDDANGQPLRQAIYPRLRYHFQFRNELLLFAEVSHTRPYGISIYSGKNKQVDFLSINNLFHPSTIDGSFLHDGFGIAGGYKIIDESGKTSWNMKPHRDRIVRFREKELAVLARAFESSEIWRSAKLVSIHSSQIISVLEKLSEFRLTVKDVERKTSLCWHETNAQNEQIIQRRTSYPDYKHYELIIGGPHFFVANPMYKTPREICLQSSNYDEIDLLEIDYEYFPRSNFFPADIFTEARDKLKGFIVGYGVSENDEDTKPVFDSWFQYYKVCFSGLVDVGTERTLQPAIIPPKVSHIDVVMTAIFRDEENLVELAGLTASIVMDFYLKTIAAPKFNKSVLDNFPLGISEPFRTALAVRTLRLNCLNQYYAPLWARQFSPAFTAQQWAVKDARLSAFASLTAEWVWATPLRNAFERRQALVEIDVLSAMALGLTLDELLLIYEVQFPVLQQNEADTWYDARGRIVFTCSRGLTGVGVERTLWENELKGRTQEQGPYRYTITRSELYRGQVVEFHPPFTRQDRAEDYRAVWRAFAEIFNQE
jgi:hypothetical protein